jgi:hypothetical protein
MFTHFGKLLAVLAIAFVPAVAQEQPPAGNPNPASPAVSPCADKQSPALQGGANLPAVPQQQPAGTPSPATPPCADKQNPPPKEDANQAGLGSKDRLFYTLPNFLTVENGTQLPPLTAGQKFKLQARSQFDYMEIPWYGILAGISQARNTSSGYGQGAEGYGKRYASEWADGSIENFMVAAVFPSVLHQDPRFYQSGKGSFWHRVAYAASRIVVTRSDSGQTAFNASEIFGSVSAAAISTYSYHPRDERTVGNTAKVWVTQMGLDTFTYNIKEFWPDIHRYFARKKPQAATAATDPTTPAATK